MSYDLDRIKKEFNEVCESAGTPCNVPIKLNGRLTRTLGRVMFQHNAETDTWYAISVEFSKMLLQTATDNSIRDVLLHEAAHFIATARTGEDHGHDKLFKAICAEIGTTNDRTTTKVERTVAVSSKYEIFCPTCNETIAKYSRMGKVLKNIDMCRCTRCGQGNLKVIQNW